MSLHPDGKRLLTAGMRDEAICFAYLSSKKGEDGLIVIKDIERHLPNGPKFGKERTRKIHCRTSAGPMKITSAAWHSDPQFIVCWKCS